MQLTTITVSVALAAFLPSAFGHGQVHNFITAKKTYAAADAYAAVDPNSPIRKLNTYGPAADFTNINITCGEGGNTPVAPLAEVAAGETVTFDWGSWTSSHSGPVMTYIAKCPNGCANFKGDTGNVWVKIDQDQFNPTRTGFEWGENIIRMKGNKYSVQIPDLEPGEYLLRHEILGLHVAGTLMGAQFYPNCVQIKLTGTGKKSLPAGIPLPGSYDPRDTGILVQLWQITAASPNYTAPGGAVILPGGTGDWGVEQFGGGAIGSKYPGPVVGAPVASPSSSKASSDFCAYSVSAFYGFADCGQTSYQRARTTPTGASVQKYGQCGGQGYTGPTACVVGSTCKLRTTTTPNACNEDMLCNL